MDELRYHLTFSVIDDGLYFLYAKGVRGSYPADWERRRHRSSRAFRSENGESLILT